MKSLIRFLFLVCVTMFISSARADLLFVGDDGGGGIYEFDTEIGGSSGVNFSADVSSANGLTSDGKNLFVSDWGGHSIIKFSLDGTSTTFATLESPAGGPAFDISGNLFVPYQADSRIDKISPDGQTITVFATNVMSPGQLAFDSHGNLFCADQKAGCIYKFDSDGTQTTFAKNVKPLGLAFDSKGNLFARSGSSILKFTPEGTQMVFAKTKGVSGLAFDSKGNLFASDGKGSIYKFENKDGRLSTKPILFAQDLGRNFFIAIMPGKMQQPSALSSLNWKLWAIVSAATLVAIGVGIGAYLLLRKKNGALTNPNTTTNQSGFILDQFQNSLQRNFYPVGAIV